VVLAQFLLKIWGVSGCFRSVQNRKVSPLLVQNLKFEEEKWYNFALLALKTPETAQNTPNFESKSPKPLAPMGPMQNNSF